MGQKDQYSAVQSSFSTSVHIHNVRSCTNSKAAMVVVQCRSRQMFDSHSIQTILKAGGLSVTVRETQRAGHATEIVRSLQLDQCDALITVGGDGTVFEALQVMSSCASVLPLILTFFLPT